MPTSKNREIGSQVISVLRDNQVEPEEALDILIGLTASIAFACAADRAEFLGKVAEKFDVLVDNLPRPEGRGMPEDWN